MRRRLLAILVLVLLLALVPLPLGSYHTYLVAQVLIFAIFAIAFNLMFGYSGLHSLGHAAFFGLGGYGLGFGLVRLNVPFWLALAAAPMTGATAALVFAMLTAKARGINFLVLTLVAAQAVWGVAYKAAKYTGGDQGLSGFGRPTVFGLSLWGSESFYYFCLVFFAVSVIVMLLVVESPLGRSLAGLRESETRLTALGYQVNLIRLIVFAISGFFSGLAGGLFAIANTLVEPSMLGWLQSGTVMLMAIVGGAEAFLGPFVGATVLVVLQQFISGYTERWTLILGVLYVVVILFAPSGLVGLGAAGWKRALADLAARQEAGSLWKPLRSLAFLARSSSADLPAKTKGREH